MPHKVVDKKVFEGIDKQIQNNLEAIKEANRFRQDADTEGFRSFLRTLKLQLEALRAKKNGAMLLCTDEGQRFALYLLGRENFAQEIIESFEDADKWEKRYRDEITELERQREEYAKLPSA